MSAVAETEIEIEHGAWRCAGCGDASNIYACAEAIVFGRIDGAELITEDHTEQIGLCGGSEECRVHQGTEPLERWDGEQWVQFEGCEDCGGRGRVPDRGRFSGRREEQCRRCEGLGGRWPGINRLNPFGAH